MALGFHNSIQPDGSRIRLEREAQGLSREALVAMSDRTFSAKTLARAEAGERVSKEKLMRIAQALGQSENYFLAPLHGPKQQNAHVVTIHHWDDERHSTAWVPYGLGNQLNFVGQTSIGTERPPPNGAWMVMQYKSSDLLGFDVVYAFYDNLRNLHEKAHQGFGKNDLVVLDVLSHGGNGNIFSAGLGAFLDLQKLVEKDRIVFWSAAPDIVDIGGDDFAGATVISKHDGDALLEYLVRYLFEVGQSYEK